MSAASGPDIRLAVAADAGLLAVLAGQLGYPSTAEDLAQRLAAIAGDERHAVYVAELPGGEVAGWVHVYSNISLVDGLQAEIGGLVVADGRRGQRIGEVLLRRAEQWGREHGCWAVFVRSNVIRIDAHRFYRRLGYEIVKTQLALRRPLALQGAGR